MDTKLETPENPVAGQYLPKEWSESVILDIGVGGVLTGKDIPSDFTYGFVSAIAFVSMGAKSSKHGMGAFEFIELCERDLPGAKQMMAEVHVLEWGA